MRVIEISKEKEMTEIKYLVYAKETTFNLASMVTPCATYEEALNVVKSRASSEEVYIAEIIYSIKTVKTISFEEWRKEA
jgi:hypothetical protein